MKILLVDDNYDLFAENIQDMGFGEFIETGPVFGLQDALDMIEKHPEADVILLDGNIGATGCGDVISFLEPETIKKIICFSATPENWTDLRKFGVRHFGGKSNFKACLKGTCSC